MKAFTFLLAILASSFLTADEPQTLPLGIVKEKPKSGRFVRVPLGYMVPYKAKIPGSDVEFEMVPIPPGEFLLGSPPTESGRSHFEGPQIKVMVKPFWMGKHEVQWKHYELYLELNDKFKRFEQARIRMVTDENEIDAVTAPSSLYEPDLVYGQGAKPNQPAVAMTQFAARQFTKWLSLTSGEFYRLPTGAEWEYACRAGTTTAYHFGNDPVKLEQYGWFAENSGDKRHVVGSKKPNPWGLYDMHGNVSEWVIDTNAKTGYAVWKGKKMNAEECARWPTTHDDQIVRGGSFLLEATECRSASLLMSAADDWKDYDPESPNSPWWFTTEPATGVGIRLFRPLHVPSDRAEKEKFWKEDIPQSLEDALSYINSNGRGAQGIANKELPAAIKKLKKKRNGSRYSP